MLTLPRELFPRIIPDVECAVQLLATCTQLRATIPPGLFEFVICRDNDDKNMFTNGYYNDNIHSRFCIIGTSLPYYHECTVMIGTWIISPHRKSYMRVFTAKNMAMYRPFRAFDANPAGILPAFDRTRSVGQHEAILSFSEWPDVYLHNVITGTYSMLVKIAKVISMDSKIFVRVAGIDELFAPQLSPKIQ